MIPRVLTGILLCLPAAAADADLILHNGKIVTVDAAFRVVEAIAIKERAHHRDRCRAPTSSKEERTPRTRVVDLGGKTVLPGLIDAHVHALEAGLSEFRSSLPALDSIAAIQDYIRAAARSRPKGAWIVVPRTLPPRLKEMRFPTREDLDVTTGPPGRLRRQLRLGRQLARAQSQRHYPRHTQPSRRRNRERPRWRTERHPSQCIAASQRRSPRRIVQRGRQSRGARPDAPTLRRGRTHGGRRPCGDSGGGRHLREAEGAPCNSRSASS